MAQTQEILERGKQTLIGNYARIPVVMSRGQGSWVWDTDGKKYLDLFAGFGGCVLGHAHPALVATVNEQAQKLWHVGNTYWTEPQIQVAERLNKFAFPGQAFLLPFRYGSERGGGEAGAAARCTVIPQEMEDGLVCQEFSWRSLAMIAATGNPAVKAGFEPEVPGFINIEGGNIDTLAGGD
jgi:acetylornithine/succinyldiaminopimelate/putrescine aminotransferase